MAKKDNIKLEKLAPNEQGIVLDMIRNDEGLRETFSGNTNTVKRVANSAYTALIKKDKTDIGFIMLVANDRTDKFEIDMGILEEFRGMGYGSQALAKLKQINLQNELEVFDLAYQDSETGTFTPVVYDDEFKNPFDYITTRDLTYVSATNTISLSKDKATFVATNYDGVGLNLIQAATIKLNDKYIPTDIIFDMQNTETETFIRTTEFTVKITNIEAKYYEVKPYSHKNNGLASALKEYKDVKNFTYHKDYVYEGESYSHISGFYTEDMVYFHHGYESDGDIYKKGDDYDYVSKKNANDGLFYVYDCTTVDGEKWNWGIVMASGETPLTYASFEEVAPSYFNISPNIFKPLGNNVY